MYIRLMDHRSGAPWGTRPTERPIDRPSASWEVFWAALGWLLVASWGRLGAQDALKSYFFMSFEVVSSMFMK